MVYERESEGEGEEEEEEEEEGEGLEVRGEEEERRMRHSHHIIPSSSERYIHVLHCMYSIYTVCMCVMDSSLSVLYYMYVSFPSSSLSPPLSFSIFSVSPSFSLPPSLLPSFLRC